MASGMLELQTVSSLSSVTYITAPSDQIPRGLLLLARLSSVNSSSVTRSSVGKRICSAGQLVDRATAATSSPACRSLARKPATGLEPGVAGRGTRQLTGPAVQRARLWAIAWTASQAPKRPEGQMVEPGRRI